MKAPLTAEQGEALRNDYAARELTIAEICEKHDIGYATLYFWVTGGPRIDGVPMFPPLPSRNPRARKTSRTKLVRRMWETMDGQIETLEQRLAGKLKPAEREREVRTMALLVKTLRELNDFDGAKRKSTQKGGSNPAPEVNDDDPRDIDEFRRELARRIAALDPSATDDAAGGT